MPPPPPPPRLPPSAPLPPPPPPIAASHAPSANSHPASAPDRSALLSQIRGGTRLKKAVTNDRSSPLTQKSQSSSRGNGTKSQSTAPSGSGHMGDLFSQGMPKLRPVGNRTGEGNSNQLTGLAYCSLQSNISKSETQVNKFSRMQTKLTSGHVELNQNALSTEANSQVVAKPTPPPSKLKPSFASDSTLGTTFPRMPLQGKTPNKNSANALSPSLPRQHIPRGQIPLKDSSNTSSSTKPLPPPKQIQSIVKPNGHLQNKPLPPSKLGTSAWNASASVTRLQSINSNEKDCIKLSQPVAHSQTFSVSGVSCDKQNFHTEQKDMSTLNVTSSKLPTRNHSAPDMNQLKNSFPRQPPPIPPTNRVIQSSSPRHPPQIKFQNGRPSPTQFSTLTRSAEPPPLPKSAPPPLPHRSPQTLPRFSGRSQGIPPPLPVRTASKQNNQQDFESRFKQMFHEIQEFPFPHYQITPHKFYMSQAYIQEGKGRTIERQMGNRLLAVKAAEC